MQLNEIFSGFNIGKGAGKFLLGAIAIGLTYLIKDPSSILSIIPDNWKTITLVGVVAEVLDYLLVLVNKAKTGK